MQRVPTTVSLLCATPGLETGHLSWVPGDQCWIFSVSSVVMPVVTSLPSSSRERDECLGEVADRLELSEKLET